MYQEDQTYDGEYEYYCQQAEAQSQYEQEEAYSYFLKILIKNGDYFQYAMNVAIDELRSKDFAISNLSAVDFLSKRMDEYIKKQNNAQL